MAINLPPSVRNFFRREWDTLSERERRVVQHFIESAPISRNTNYEFADTRTWGDRAADNIAGFGGSWTFIFSFAGVLLAWVAVNSLLLARRGEAFDPFPYILLNLFLSMLAALQAPIIMMSQNRQAAKDRLDAAHDYEVNLKAEMEICALHEKLNALRAEHQELLRLQREQTFMLERLLRENLAARDERTLATF